MPEVALGACQDGVVVGQHGRGAAFAEVLAVDARGARHQTVGGRAGDQVVEVAAEPLGGDREPAVLDERSGVDEIVDVLAGGAPVRRASALDGVWPCGVLGQRPAAQQLGVVVTDGWFGHPRRSSLAIVASTSSRNASTSSSL